MGVTYLRARSGDVSYPTSSRRLRFWGEGTPAPTGNFLMDRTFDYRWMGEDASSGNAWVDDVFGKSLVWNNAVGYTITSETASDLPDDAFTNKSVIRIDAGEANLTVYPWGNTTGDTNLAEPVNQSMWIRSIVKHIDPTINTGNHAIMVEFRDSAPTAGLRIARTTMYNNTAGSGGGVVSHWNATTSVVGPQVLALPDTRDEWNIHDAFIDGATGEISFYANGKTASVNSANGATAAWVSPYVQIGMRANCDVKMIAVAFGANADAFSATLHNADVAILTGS